MQFNSEADNQDLISDITFLLGAGIDLNNYTLKDRTRNVNARLGIVWQIIFESYGGWKFVDDNVSSTSDAGVFALQTITSGTSLYGIPTGALTIPWIEIMYASGQPYRRLFPMTEEEWIARGGDAAFPSNAVPLYYIPQGDVIKLLPTPNYTLASALKVGFDQAMTNFTTSDTVATPGFASIFHRILSIGASIDYAAGRLPAKVPSLQGMWTDYETRMRNFYSKRYKDRFPARMGPGSDLVENYS